MTLAGSGVFPLTCFAPDGAKTSVCALVAINISLRWSESGRTVALEVEFTFSRLALYSCCLISGLFRNKQQFLRAEFEFFSG
jgi:hypothetical protein